MKKFLALIMALALVACVFAACGKTAETPTEPSSEEAVNNITAESTDIPRMIINSEPYVITAKDGFENAGVTGVVCDATAKYSFKASSGDVKWDIYVLDTPFTDGARYLIQANSPALSGDGELEIEEGKIIYVACSENAFTADAASDASLEINYAE